MSEPTALPPDPLSGSTLAAYWSYGYDMPDDLGGGFVTGHDLSARGRFDDVVLAQGLGHLTGTDYAVVAAAAV